MPPLPFNQTDLENIYDGLYSMVVNISEPTAINVLAIKTIVNQDTPPIVDSFSLINQTSTDANGIFSSTISNHIANSRVILKADIVCSPRPQIIQPENDWIVTIIYIQK